MKRKVVHTIRSQESLSREGYIYTQSWRKRAFQAGQTAYTEARRSIFSIRRSWHSGVLL